MKTVFWVLIAIAGFSIPLIFMLVVPVIIFNLSWWWLGGMAIFELIVGIILGIVLLILFLKKQPEKKLEMDIKGAKEHAIFEWKYDQDNGDNFKINHTQLKRVGENSKDKTPVLILKGKGTELNNDLVTIINMNNFKKEMTRLVNPVEDKIQEGINGIAEHPADEEVSTTEMKRDMFGNVTPTITTRRMSKSEKKAEEDKKASELANGM